MKRSLVNITGFFKAIAFALALMTLLLQPIVYELFLLSDIEIEVSEMDLEEDSEEKEDQKEDDRKEDLLKLQYANAHKESMFYLSTILTYQVYQLTQDFSLEIPIPPPELA